MIYTEMRSARSRRGRVTAALGAGLLLLAGCGGAEPAVESAASPTPQEITTETVVEATNRPAPTPSPHPSTTDEAAAAIPDPSEIDVAYMQEVADVFAHREGEILRLIMEQEAYTPAVQRLLEESFGDGYLELSAEGLQIGLKDPGYLDRYEDLPGDPQWTVEEVFTSQFPCVGVRAAVDVSDTRKGGPYPPRPTLFSFQLREEASAFSPWRLDDVAVGEDLEGVNLCAE